MVLVLAPERETFQSAPMMEAPAWSLVWPMVEDLIGGTIG